MYLDSIEKAEALAGLCRKYGQWFMVDVYNGHYCVDGASLLGLISFIGNEVEVKLIPREGCTERTKEKFFEEMNAL